MHTAGDCVRKITCDPTHGIALDEQADILETMYVLEHLFVLNRRITNLPRKVKMSVRGTISDNIISAFNDISIRLADNMAYICVCGGLGRSPQVGIKFIKIVKHKIANIVEAFIRVYCSLSNTDKYSSRTKALLLRFSKNDLIKYVKPFNDIKVAMPYHCHETLIFRQVTRIV